MDFGAEPKRTATVPEPYPNFIVNEKKLGWDTDWYGNVKVTVHLRLRHATVALLTRTRSKP